MPEGGLLTNNGAGNILRGWRGFPVCIWIAVQEKSKDNAETRRARRFAEKSSEKRAGPVNSFGAQKTRLKDQRYI